MTKLNPSPAENRRQALRTVDATGSLDGVHVVMARRFQAKGYIRKEGGRITLTKMGKAVMEGRIGKAGRGAVDMGSARHKAERGWDGRRRKATGSSMAAHMTGDGTTTRKRIEREERAFFETEGDRLKAEWDKEQTAYQAAVKRILGPQGMASAVKIARADGTPFHRAELESLQTAGWEIHPGGTIAAQVGKALKGVRQSEFNPADALEKALGPESETRAVVLVAQGITEETLHQLRGAGYDLSSAPKRLREGSSVKTNPTETVKRFDGAHLEILRDLWRHYPKGSAPPVDFEKSWKDVSTAELGQLARAGINLVSNAAAKEIQRRVKTNPTAPQPGLQKRLYELLKKGPWQVADLTTKTGHSASEVETALYRLGTMGLAHPAERTMFGATWQIGGLQQGLAFNTTGHKRPRAATPPAQAKQAGTMTKVKPSRKAPAKAKKTAAKVAKKPAAIGPDKVQPLKSKAALRHRAASELANLLKGAAKTPAKAKAKTLKPTLEKFTLTGRFNPSTAGNLAQAATRKALMSKKPQDHAKALELHMQAAREYAWQNKLGKTQAERDAAGAHADEHVGISELHEALAGITPATHAPKVAKAKVAKAKAKPLASKAKTLKWAKQAGLHITSFNPTSAGDMARVWKAWTGTDPDQTISFDVEKPTVSLKAGGRVSIPEKVVILGRVSKFISKTGRLADFGANGPLMVTDAKAERIWLLAEKPFHFDLEPSVITYLARKPKFGDRGTIEYVHGFKGRVRAVMAGQVGAMTGAYRITPRGLED